MYFFQVLTLSLLNELSTEEVVAAVALGFPIASAFDKTATSSSALDGFLATILAMFSPAPAIPSPEISI